MKISLLCPTRERTDWMRRIWNSAYNMAYDKTNFEMIYYIDEDDIESLKTYDQMKSDQIKVVVRPPKTVNLTDMYNKCWEAASGEIFVPLNDDMIFESKDWDKYVCDAFNKIPDKIALVYGLQFPGVLTRSEKVVCGFIHKNWTDILGRMSPPYFEYHHADVWIRRIADALGRKTFVPEISIIHYHVATYGNGRKSAEQKSSIPRAVNRLLFAEKEHEILEDTEKLRKFIEEFKIDDH